MEISVTTIPQAKKNKVTELKPGRLEVKLKAKPERNAANALLVEVLADYFKVPAAAITIVAGHHGRHKRVAIKDAHSPNNSRSI